MSKHAEGARPVDAHASLEGHSDKQPSDEGRELGGKAAADNSQEGVNLAIDGSK